MHAAGISYFPLDCNLGMDMKLIEAEFGLTGFGVVVKLWQDIYAGHGYYIEWTDEVALLFADKVRLGGSVVSEIVSAAVRRGIFDKDLLDRYGILTSSGIQKRYFEIVKRRKEIQVKSEYLLVPCAQICKNVSILQENVDISSENANIFPQSKGKESKGKKRERVPPTIGEKHSYGEYDNVLLTDGEFDKLKEEFPDYEARIQRLSEYIESKGAKYSSHYATIRAWARKDKETNQTESPATYDMEQFGDMIFLNEIAK